MSQPKKKSKPTSSTEKSGKRFDLSYYREEILKWWNKMMRKLSYQIILLFAQDRSEFFLKRSEEIIDLMKTNKMFEDDEYVFNVLDVFDKAGFSLSLGELRELLGRPKMDNYSLITKSEWEQIFPKIVLLTVK